ncbi:MAG TPA: hypothetical protein ENK57_09560 [Polyangiaceae bacterium]|nr:hypothetical protein [Polyangiaceae bacterium]
MTDFGTLYFMPWLRRGLARSLSQTAVDGAPTTVAGTIDVSVVVGDGTGSTDSAPVEQTIRLRGPGDVIGLNPSQIVRTDPRDGVQDFEHNYFVTVELATPDLPWMFTPAAPGADNKLVPWLALVVVEDTDGIAITSKSGAPLPVLSIASPADASQQLPDLAEAWAWAHVQSTASVPSKGDVSDAFESAPEDFMARLVCPRRLEEDTRYIAAVVPTFDAGRRAGLGLTPLSEDDIETAESTWWMAWSGQSERELPVFHSWTFKTGTGGDFEALVTALTPREIEAGTNDFDIGDQGTDQLPPDPPEERLVTWTGALVGPIAPVIELDADGEQHRDDLMTALRDVVQDGFGSGSEPTTGEEYIPLEHDPVVGPPAYGALPAQVDTLPDPVLSSTTTPTSDNDPLWLGEVNSDPVHRSVAGLGAEVVRRNQETLMASAWLQAASLKKINRTMNWTRLAAEVGERQKATKVVGLSDASILQLAAPGAARLKVGEGETAAGRLSATALPGGMASSAFRRVGRPDGPVGRAFRNASAASSSNASTAATAACVADIDSALTYTSFVRPDGLQIASETLMVGIPTGATEASTRSRTATGPTLPPGFRAASMPATFSTITPWVKADKYTAFSPLVGSGDDELGAAAADIQDAIRPKATLSAKLEQRIAAPNGPFEGGALPASLTAEPEFTDPLYEEVRNIDPELLLPGLSEIPDDTIGLTEVNSAYIEAFLLGANHELAREFAWREYPAELDATWLRTFWDSIPPDDPTASDRGVGEHIEDIGPVDGWDSGVLGTHPAEGAPTDGMLVLIIRGALLRKYPDTVIYATRAIWNEERPAEDGGTVAANTMREEKLDGDGLPFERIDPIMIGALDAKTVFLGFPFDTAEALGPVDADGEPTWTDSSGGEDAGVFFVFEEPPAGPRFGLDVGDEAHAGAVPEYWREASWYHQLPAGGDLSNLPHASATGELAGEGRWYDDPTSASGGKFRATWGKHAAAMARITLQRPVRMLVHASGMLPEKEA